MTEDVQNSELELSLEALEQQALGEEVVEEVVDTSVESEAEVEYSDTEKAAMDKGWVPPDKYQGAGEALSADEFLRREPLFAKISESSKKVKALEQTVKQLIEHNRKLNNNQKQARLEELERMKVESVEYADPEGYKKAVAEQQRILSIQDDTPDVVNPAIEFDDNDKQAFSEFKAKHEKVWLNSSSAENTRIYQAADALYSWAASEEPGKPAKYYLKVVEDKLAALYPHKFKNPNLSKPQAVGSNSNALGKTSAPSRSFKSLTQAEQHFCKEFVRMGGTEKEYIELLGK